MASGQYPVEDYVQRPVTVTAVTLSDFMKSDGLAGIDLLWMDIQGAELLALKGLGSSITTVKMIHLEVEFIEVYEGQALWPDLHRFLRGHGFRLLTFTTFGKYSADAIFYNPALVANCRRRLPDGLVYYRFLIAHMFRALYLRILRILS